MAPPLPGSRTHSLPDPIDVSVVVALPAEAAFAIFTDEIDAWWKRGPRHRFRAPWNDGVLELEARQDGRLLERYPDGSELVIGRVRVCEPAKRLVLDWGEGAPAEVSQVEIRFEPVDGGCRVRVRHSGLAALPTDHPARQGRADRELLESQARLWAENLESLRAHVRATPTERS